MRFAEVFLRLGTALVAWMMLFAHFLWLAALHVIGCGPDGDELQRVLLGLPPVTCVFAALVGVTRPFSEIHGMLGWLRLPLGVLILLALRTIWGTDIKKLRTIDQKMTQNFLQRTTAHKEAGHLTEKEGIYTLTTQGKLLADRIAMELFEEE